MKRRQRKRQSQIADMGHGGAELGRRVEDPRESHSVEQSDRRAQPTAGRRAQPTASEKGIPNCRRESKRTERAVPTAGRDVRREQCLEERSWTDGELKVINAWQLIKNGKQGNTQSRLKRILVTISRKQASRKGSDTATTGGAANSYRSQKKPSRLQRRIPKNGKHEMEFEIQKVVRSPWRFKSRRIIAERKNKLQTVKKVTNSSSKLTPR